MSYQRFGKPRIYTDNINWLLSLGKIATSDITFTAASSTMASGSSVIEMFDMKPSNVQTISANGNTDEIKIDINTNITTDTSNDSNFVAILGHNFESAHVRFRIDVDDAQNSTFSTHPAMTSVVNATVSGSGATSYCEPPANGWSLATFPTVSTTTNDNQYHRLLIDNQTSGDNDYMTDIKIGAILIGEMVDIASHSPDLNIKYGLEFDGVEKRQSIGGQTYGTAPYLAGATWFHPPYSNAGTTSANALRRIGRVKLGMKFSYLADTDIWPQEFNDNAQMVGGEGESNMLTNLIQRTAGGLHPFLFQMDSGANTDDDSYLWMRLDEAPTFEQVAHRMWSCNLNMTEEF